MEEEIRVIGLGNVGEEDYDGLGMDFRLTKGLYFRLEWRRLTYDHSTIDPEVDVLWLGLWKRFGVRW